jgi:hypothetical protein
MPVTAGRSRRHAVGIAVVLAWLLCGYPAARQPTAWMLAAGASWLVASVAVDLARLLGADRVVDFDAHLGRLVPAVAARAGRPCWTTVPAEARSASPDAPESPPGQGAERSRTGLRVIGGRR